jgi:branched-chain amino acid transport system substrate-binding protein
MVDASIGQQPQQRLKGHSRCCMVSGILIVFLLLAINGCTIISGVDDLPNINVAVIGPFEGDLSVLGTSLRNGVVLATEEQNAEGGLLGKQVQLGLYDSACDYNTAREVTLQAINELGVNYIIGAVCSDASEGVAQIASEEGVLVINPASVAEGLTLDIDGEVRHYVYRIPFVDPQQGRAAAWLAIDRLTVKTASVLVPESGVYEASLADAFEEEFTASGGEVLMRETYERAAESYFDNLAEIRDANAEVIYAPGYYDVINKIALEARAYGINQPFLGSDGWGVSELNTTVLEGSYYTVQFFSGEPRARVLDWTRTYESRYLVVPDVMATLGYDAAHVLFDAIEQSGTTAPYELAGVIQDMEFDAVTGQITFDEIHNPIKPVIVLRIQNGSVVFDSRINVDDLPE